MRGALGPAIALLLASGTGASAQRNASGFTLTKPKPDWGGLALAVINLHDSDNRAPGYYCPAPAPGDQDSICLGAAMFDQDGSIQRVLAETPDFGEARYGTFRTIGGHAARSIEGGWWLALLERTKDGYTWVPWRTRLERGKACLPAVLIKQFSVTVPADATTDIDGDRCLKGLRSF